MKKIQYFIISVVLFAAMLGSCKKAGTPAMAPYQVRMTDAPGPYSAVYVDIQGVEISGANGKNVTLNVNKGVYDLIRFSNGMDTLIASANIEVTEIQQIRLILGQNNSVVYDSVTYPLSTPSADQSGLKLQVHQKLEAGVLYMVLLDFDANKSIVQTGTGTYKLKPVLRTIETPISGAIKGQIYPAGLLAMVTATNSANVSFTTTVSASGNFLLLGLPAGIYTVTITPAAPLNSVTQNNVVVTTGLTTSIGTISF